MNKSIQKRQLHESLEVMLQKCYWCERTTGTLLQSFRSKPASKRVKQQIEKHRASTALQRSTLLEVFDNLKIPVQGKRCAGFSAIYKDSGTQLQQAQALDQTLPIVLMAQQLTSVKISYYSITAIFYRLDNHFTVAELLEQNLLEDKERYAEWTVTAAQELQQSASKEEDAFTT
jgi:ferritin-like metal-binding protein YciE